VAWELKGVPVRVELGPRELADGNVTVVTRHRREKEAVALSAAGKVVASILERVGPELLAEATAARETRMEDVDTLEAAVAAAENGFARVRLGALGSDGEDRLAEHALSIRCLQRPDGTLAEPDDSESGLTAVVGRSY
jgi:prolyl-tRNA synthetase